MPPTNRSANLANAAAISSHPDRRALLIQIVALHRPAIRAISFDEAGEAIACLIAVAASDTGQSGRVVDFLLAWWNGSDNGHFPVLHLCNCDAIIAEDMVMVMAYLTQEPTVYADVWASATQW